MFVSHQWFSNDHPDPSGHQFKVLQGALRNIMSGQSRVSLPVTAELFYGRLKTPEASDFKSGRLFVWYDYFSCPQGASDLDNIVTYVSRCEYFVILCAGLFTLETDRARVGRVLVQMVWKKLQYYLEQGDLHNFRYLLSTQDICCLSGLGFLPLEGLMPGFVSQADPFAYPEAFAVERFLHDTGFKAVSERDPAGWTPMCYAVLSGKQFLVE
ncbi:unnamed protein product, partial [Symbiodinium sp. CCMP2456]